MNLNSKIRTDCLVCGESIRFEKHPELGDLVTCGYCDETLEVIKLNTIVVDWPYDSEEVEREYNLEQFREL